MTTGMVDLLASALTASLCPPPGRFRVSGEGLKFLLIVAFHVAAATAAYWFLRRRFDRWFSRLMKKWEEGQ